MAVVRHMGGYTSVPNTAAVVAAIQAEIVLNYTVQGF